ncbi:MAG: phosphotransferase [Acidimicrobiia bacterium]
MPPEPIRSTYSAWRWSVAWEWPGLATTWRLEGPTGEPVQFLKVVQSGHYPTALDEAGRLRWARAYLPVPEVIGSGSDGTVDWLITVELGGVDASRHRLKADPVRLVPILARGLAAFHAAASVPACPYDFRVATSLAHVGRRVRHGIANPKDLHAEHAHLTLDAALAELERLAPASEDLVVCHGDYCFPNVLLDEQGRLTGYVDLGELAVADRWWDVTVGAWSTTWNVGPGWEHLFYESYGIEPDEQRITFNRLLYDLSS